MSFHNKSDLVCFPHWHDLHYPICYHDHGQNGGFEYLLRRDLNQILEAADAKVIMSLSLTNNFIERSENSNVICSSEHQDIMQGIETSQKLMFKLLRRHNFALRNLSINFSSRNTLLHF